MIDVKQIINDYELIFLVRISKNDNQGEPFTIYSTHTPDNGIPYQVHIFDNGLFKFRHVISKEYKLDSPLYGNIYELSTGMKDVLPDNFKNYAHQVGKFCNIVEQHYWKNLYKPEIFNKLK